jgi:hypothetical protein
MIRLVCTLCRERIVGRDAIEAHVAGHRLVEDDVRVLWASGGGLVLRPRDPKALLSEPDVLP